MPKNLRHPVLAVILLVAMVMQLSIPAFAGTTGSISGIVTDSAQKPIPGVSVRVASPSQTAQTTTDAQGRFSFLTLSPDTYNLSFEKQGYEPATESGVTVQADQTVNVNPQLAAHLQTIGTVASRAANSLVRPGETASVYSVNPSQQAAAATLGGGANLNSAYSAIASVPGVLVPIGNAGWGQTIQIRGGDYTQTGNEVDGIPINRSFDQYAASNLSSLGSQEVQVYTGNAPSDAQAVGIAGFVNQVIRTGTYPMNISSSLGFGTPGQYNHGNLEIGGATANRLFNYYLGTGGYTQQLNIIDSNNGQNGQNVNQGYGSLYNFVAANCGAPNATAGCYANGGDPHDTFLGGVPLGPGGYAVAPVQFGFIPTTYDRETIGNFHFVIPKKSGVNDNVQLLYDYGLNRNYPNDNLYAWNGVYDNVINGTVNGNTVPGFNFAGGTIPNIPGACPALGGTYAGTPTACAGAVNPFYVDQQRYTGPLGAPFTAADVNAFANVPFSNSPAGRTWLAPVSPSATDGEVAEFAIAKLQYQHAFSDKAYARIYGYTLYSNRLDDGIVSLFQNYVGAFSTDYTIESHTRGVALNSAYQITPQHLISFDAGYTTSNTTRFRNDSAAFATAPVAYLVSSANPVANGCYAVPAGAVAGAAATRVSCSRADQYVLGGFPPNAFGAGVPQPLQPTNPAVVAGTEGAFSCGGAPCQYYAVDTGQAAASNAVRPKFFNAAFSDTWKPTPNLTVNASLRLDDFMYDLIDTNTFGNQLLTQDYNASHCIQGTTIRARAYGTACPAGFSPTALSAASPSTIQYNNVLQPRFGLTYQLRRNDVLRASYGRFSQPAETSAVQATNVQAGAPSSAFYSNFGFNSFARFVEPEISYNVDLSWEHEIPGAGLSWRMTPFYRKTDDEFATILVNPKTNFVANVNGQNRTASGLEFAFTKGDFNRDGLAAQLSYTYTHATNRYKIFPGGGSFVTGINQQILNFNQYTSFCATNPSDVRCAGNTAVAPTISVAAAPCYTPATAAGPGAPVAAGGCGAGTIANPYFNAAPGGLLDPGAAYVPYNQAPGIGPNAVSASYLIPHVLSLVAQYKHGPLKITPSVQFQGGAKYGSPLAVVGVAPDSCAGNLAGTNAANDPRYPVGGTGATYDAQTCSGLLSIPNPYTGGFDGIGSLTQPNLIDFNLAISYDVNPNVTIQLIGANIYGNCFGGTKEPWLIGGRLGCSYQEATSVGNVYNPSATIQPGFLYPYFPTIATSLQSITQEAINPFQLYFNIQFKHL